MELMPITPMHEPSGRTRPWRTPGAVTAVAVLLWIGVVALAILARLLVSLAPSPKPGLALPAAAICAVGAIVAAPCAVMIRRGSRGWRRVAVLLCVLAIVAGIDLPPLGWLVAVLNGLSIYLLVGAAESRRFFGDP
jgi:hypothetical protein